MTTTAPERRSTPLGEYIQARRAEADLTQEQLAERLLFTQSAVAQWELGHRTPTAKAIVAIARELPGASAEEMLDLLAGEGTK